MLLTAVAAAVATAGALALIGTSRARARGRAVAASNARGVRAMTADGIVAGAESIALEGEGDRAILLLHGFNDTPQSLAHLARALHADGWMVSAPLLPHHGRGARELAQYGNADAWIAAARDAWAALRHTSPHAVLAGQSMGGALAVILAAECPPSALVLLAPYLHMGPLPRLLSTVWPLWQLVVPVLVASPRNSVRDPVARAQSLGSGQFTPRLVAELREVADRAWGVLSTIQVSTLTIQGREDYRIPSPTAARAFARLGAADKTLVWLDGVGHVVAADACRDDVAARVRAWLGERVPA
jgi:carboxylesterase